MYLGDRRLPDIDAELEQFTVDARGAPKRVRDAHVSDELPDLRLRPWPAAAWSRFPSPIGSEPGAMPTDHCFRLEDFQRIQHLRSQTIEPGKHQAINVAQSHSLRRSPPISTLSIVTKVRKLKTGESVGAIPFTRGSLAQLLRNRFYIGEVAFKGEVLKGEQPAILDKALFDAVQAKLNEQVTNHKAKWMKSEALLAGRIFDDRGNRMTPSHARRGNVKYRYYLSSALLQSTAERAGSVRRVPATDVEALVIKSVREHLKPSQPVDDRNLISTGVARVEVQPKQLVIHLTGEPKATANRKKIRATGILCVPWQRTPSTRRREILLPKGMPPKRARPIRSETRATLVAAIARGRRWLAELTTDASITTENIAKRQGCSVRKVNMTISLAFLAPDIVKAAIDGRLPHGMGVARLTDLPAEWSRQHEMLGLPSH